ncbi:MAG: phenylacetate--CoA ligase family protein [Alphaproteobacteria bacterium]|nr:phenylacetate--CoA ligase family protein [Alphaproteobacteria bacterium]
MNGADHALAAADAIPESGRPGMAWPALPGPNNAVFLSILHQLEDSQWWPADALARRQFAQLETLVAHAFDTVPFYRERLKSLVTLPRGALDAAVWRSIPLLTRDDLAEAEESILSRALPESHGVTEHERTSGATGKPVSVQSTGLVRLFNNAFATRWRGWAAWDHAGTLATIVSAAPDQALPPDGVTDPGWLPLFHTGPSLTLNMRSTIDEQIDWLVRTKPHYLLTYPSNLRALALECAERGIILENLRGVATRSEALDDGLRDLCREVWRVPLTDAYSTVEAGMIALQCPDHAHYHLQAENVYVEVLRDDGTPCAPGEFGRVVVTKLHNFATPLIRYDIGDIAEVGPPCACGRGLPVLSRILGRTRNLLTYPDGRSIRPRLNEGFVDQPAIRQFQVRQPTADKLEVRFVVRRPLTPEEEAYTRRALTDYLGYPFAIEIIYVDALPRAASGKWEEFVSALS